MWRILPLVAVLSAGTSHGLELPLPTAQQLAWQSNEIMALIHFNMATFFRNGAADSARVQRYSLCDLRRSRVRRIQLERIAEAKLLRTQELERITVDPVYECPGSQRGRMLSPSLSPHYAPRHSPQ